MPTPEHIENNMRVLRARLAEQRVARRAVSRIEDALGEHPHVLSFRTAHSTRERVIAITYSGKIAPCALYGQLTDAQRLRPAGWDLVVRKVHTPHVRKHT